MQRFISHVARSLALGLLAVGGAVAAQGHIQMYSATLSGAAEAPPNASPGTGSGLVTFDIDLVTMRVQASFTGLTGNSSAAHIHSATAVPGVSTAGVATQTPTFGGFPLGVTSGIYDRTFDMTQASSYNAAFITANGGTVSSALNALVFGLDNGRAYLNIHTSTFSGGEIRGFLTPVPEPTGAFLTAGLAGGGLLRRRK